MNAYQLAIEFDVVRRIGWADEDLGDHIDAVIDRLRQAEGVTAMEATANLDTGRTHMLLHFMSPTDDAERHGRLLLSVALRSCGAGHNGLLALGEEAAVRPERNQWSGLRIPNWNVRQVVLQPEPIAP